MPRARRPPPEPEPPARRDYGAWSISWFPSRSCWRVRPPSSVDPKRSPHYEKTREDAERWAAQERARLARPAGVLADDVTLGDYLGWWVQTTAASKRWSAATVALYESHNRRLGDLLDLPLRTIRRDHLQARIAELLTVGVREYTRPPHRRGIAAVSVAATVRTWRAALADAVDEYELLDRNPAARLKLPEVVREERETWTPDEARALLGGIRGHRHEVIFALLFGGGLRIGEALALRWADVDWQRSRVSLHATGTKILQEHTKSRRRRRVPLPPAVMAALKRQRIGQAWEAEFVVEHQPGKRWNYSTVRDSLTKLCADLGIAHHTSHAARHHAASHLSERGLSLAAVSRILGHGSSAITASVYLHASEKEVERAAELLSELFSEADGDAQGADSGPTGLRTGLP